MADEGAARRSVVVVNASDRAERALHRVVSLRNASWEVKRFAGRSAMPWVEIGRAGLLLVGLDFDEVEPFLDAWRSRGLDTPFALEAYGVSAPHVVKALHAGVVDVLLEPPDASRMVDVLLRAGVITDAGLPFVELLSTLDFAQLPLFRELGEHLRRLDAALDEEDQPVAKTIALLKSMDPSLPNGIITATNAAYGQEREVGSLREAIIRLGREEVRLTAREVLLASAYDLDDELFVDLGAALRDNHVATAAAARALAPLAKIDPILAGDTALLHNLGEIAALGVVESHVVKERGSRRFRTLVIDALVEHHERVGAEVLAAVGADPLLRQVAGCHHHIDTMNAIPGSTVRLTRLVLLAWELAKQSGYIYPCMGDAVQVGRLCRQLGVDEMHARRAVRRVVAKREPPEFG